MADSERFLNRGVQWSPGAETSVRPSIAIARAKWAIDRYGELGVRQPPGNRLEKSRSFLAEFAGRKAPFDSVDEELLHRIAECTQTCIEHYLIARSTESSSGRLSDEMLRKLKESLTGAEVADRELDSPGRDTQFELFMHALLVMGDVSVWIAEPDLRFLYNAEEVGLAAKRVKRPGQLRPRFNGAVKQIERSGIRGFVAVNADLLLRDLGSEGNADEGLVQFEEWPEAFRRIDEAFASHPLVLGCLAFGTDAIWDLEEGQPSVQVRSFRDYKVYAKTSEEAEVAERFFPHMRARIRQRLAQLE